MSATRRRRGARTAKRGPKYILRRMMILLTAREKIRLHAVRSMALALMEQHNVSHYQFQFEVGRGYAGKCSYDNVITLSLRHAISDNWDKIKNTMLHEIAHALVGPERRHRLVWQVKARELGVRFNRKYRE